MIPLHGRVRPLLLPLLALFSILAGLAQPAAALPPTPNEAYLVKDLNPQNDISRSSSPMRFTTVGAITYFTAYDSLSGGELWRTDGTAAGTLLVKDLTPGARGPYDPDLTSIPEPLFHNANGTLFFSFMNQLWKSDGATIGTRLVKTLPSVNPNIFPPTRVIEMFSVAGILYFTATDPGNAQTALWRSDGTEAGTIIVNQHPPETVYPMGGALYYSDNGLWRTDSAGGNPVQLTSTPLSELTVVGNRLFFLARDAATYYRDLWVSDGASAGTRLVTTLTSQPSRLFQVNGTLVIGMSNGLWTSDGTGAGTVMLKQFIFINFNDLQIMNGKPLFPAASSTNMGYDWWTTDGTATGTVLIKDVHPESSNGTIERLMLAGNKLYFVWSSNSSPGEQRELWVSDGATAGTLLVRGHSANFTYGVLGQVNGQLVFGANDGIYGLELWVSDGATTSLLKDINQGYGGSTIQNPVAVGSKLFFLNRATGPISTNDELWVSNGTDGSTIRLKNTGLYDAVLLGSANNLLFFIAEDGERGHTLWRSDGTLAGTMLVMDLQPGFGTPYIWSVGLGNTFFFSANDGVSGQELWRTDGTVAGTRLVADINPGADSSGAAWMTLMNGIIYFTASDAAFGRELWRTDGTAAGTFRITDIAPGSDSSSPVQLSATNGWLYFASGGYAPNGKLWRTNGTTAGTQVITPDGVGAAKQINQVIGVNGALFFHLIYEDPYTIDLWFTDGTQTGTRLIRNRTSSYSSWVAANNQLFFDAEDPATGRELWRSDGTLAGTMIVKDINPGPENGLSALSRLVAVPTRNGVVFAGTDRTGGSELWQSNGSAAGTTQIQDLAPGAGSSDPSSLAVAGTLLYFSADNGTTGRELWAMSIYPLALNNQLYLPLATR